MHMLTVVCICLQMCVYVCIFEYILPGMYIFSQLYGYANRPNLCSSRCIYMLGGYAYDAMSMYMLAGVYMLEGVYILATKCICSQLYI